MQRNEGYYCVGDLEV